MLVNSRVKRNAGDYAMVDSMGGATLYELLLFRILDDIRVGMRDDLDIEGEMKMLRKMTRYVVDRDESFAEEYEEILTDFGVLDNNDEDGNRELNLELLGITVPALMRAGYLDHAPVPESTEGLNYL